VRDEFVRAANVLELREPDLGDDRTELARGGGDAVGSRAVTRRERLAGNDESRRIWSC